MDKTRVAEKRYRDKQNREDCKIYNNQLQKTKYNKIAKEKTISIE